MALKDWDDLTMTDNDCIRDSSEWLDMVDAIKYKSSCSFIIYDDFDYTNQKFKFTYSGDDSILEGRDAANGDLILKANTADAYPFALLEGAGDITLDSHADIVFKEQGTQVFKFERTAGGASRLNGGTSGGLAIYGTSDENYPRMYFDDTASIYFHSHDDIYFTEQGTQMFKFSLNDDDSIIEGGDSSSDDLYLYANSDSQTPFIKLFGSADISINVDTDKHIRFEENGSEFIRFLETSGDAVINTDEANMDLVLDSNADIYFKEQGDQSFKFQYNAGPGQSVIMGGDASGEDLFLYGNSVDAQPFISIEGLADITLDSYADIYFKERGAQFFKFQYYAGPGQSILMGGDASGEDLFLYGNSVDAQPFISIEGLADITLDSYADIYFKEQGTQMAKLSYNANVSTLEGGSASGDDLILKANSTDADSKIEIEGLGDIFLDANGVVKFGTYAALSGESVTGYITIKDAGGTDRKLAVVA